jgi:hypothetical protein
MDFDGGRWVIVREVWWGPTEVPMVAASMATCTCSGSGWAEFRFWEVLGIGQLLDTIYLGIATKCQEKSMEAKTTLLVSTVWIP